MVERISPPSATSESLDRSPPFAGDVWEFGHQNGSCGDSIGFARATHGSFLNLLICECLVAGDMRVDGRLAVAYADSASARAPSTPALAPSPGLVTKPETPSVSGGVAR